MQRISRRAHLSFLVHLSFFVGAWHCWKEILKPKMLAAGSRRSTATSEIGFRFSHSHHFSARVFYAFNHPHRALSHGQDDRQPNANQKWPWQENADSTDNDNRLPRLVKLYGEPGFIAVSMDGHTTVPIFFARCLSSPRDSVSFLEQMSWRAIVPAAARLSARPTGNRRISADAGSVSLSRFDRPWSSWGGLWSSSLQSASCTNSSSPLPRRIAL
ncbi:hypothetical protein B0H67DRAFT_90171 [Lasiosphaeris hirsuta]|uniref:Secreted protein n=1 Tax=Lasiosphaeris hirsuta TaxID=260670 RepID=A0AA40EE26_9PEZI|nr:hypothetical protein B0H67DRAFT_90171 [Lasiosphaeris hirsuta]